MALQGEIKLARQVVPVYMLISLLLPACLMRLPGQELYQVGRRKVLCEALELRASTLRPSAVQVLILLLAIGSSLSDICWAAEAAESP